MGLRQANSEGRGGFARIFKPENKGKYSVAQLTTSRKKQDGDGYETDFSDGRVRFVGQAHTALQEMNVGDKGVTIQITDFEVTNKYDKEKKTLYTNYVVYGFNQPDSNGSNTSAMTKKQDAKPAYKNDTPAEDDDELPF